MTISSCDWRRTVVCVGLVCTTCAVTTGCGEPITNSGVAHPGNQPSAVSSNPASELSIGDSIESKSPVALSEGTQTAGAGNSTAAPAPDPAAGQADPTKPPNFEVEGPDGALRVTFGDLDLQKQVNLQTITADCVEKMPGWLKALVGKRVRLRGYMKPGFTTEGISQFLFVRSTDLCCFQPKGRVDHMAATTLKPGTTTDFIDLKPFDVVGTFRIDLMQLDDGLIFLLYHVDDATIIR
jgi:hypothetical protein